MVRAQRIRPVRMLAVLSVLAAAGCHTHAQPSTGDTGAPVSGAAGTGDRAPSTGGVSSLAGSEIPGDAAAAPLGSHASWSDAGAVPTTLAECFAALAHQLPPETIAAMKAGTEQDMVRYHFSLGQWMRNEWGLWQGGPLREHLSALGLRHPDDMSGLILETFWCHLHGQPLRVAERVAKAQDYWRRMAKPKPARPPGCQDEIDLRVTQFLKEADGVERAIHAGRCPAEGKLWAWEVDRGWFEPDPELRAKLEPSLPPAPGRSRCRSRCTGRSRQEPRPMIGAAAAWSKGRLLAIGSGRRLGAWPVRARAGG
jgi:hypothetical protein